MQLLVNGIALPISQMGPDFVLVDVPVDHEAATATIVLQVDESERAFGVLHDFSKRSASRISRRLD